MRTAVACDTKRNGCGDERFILNRNLRYRRVLLVHDLRSVRHYSFGFFISRA